MHVVHHSIEDSDLVVYNVLFELECENVELQRLLDHVNHDEVMGKNDTASVSDFNVANLLPLHANTMYFSYMGSLTTPPCTEIVTVPII